MKHKVAHEIIFGINPVTEALKARRRKIYRLFVIDRKDNRRITAIETMAVNSGIEVERIPNARLLAMTAHSVHQGIAAETESFPVAGPDELFDGFRDTYRDRHPFILLTDSISDPGNLGALIRTAVCAGVSGIVVPKNRSARPTPAVSKASAGAMEHARIYQVTNLSEIIKRLKKKDFWIIGLDRNADTTIYETDMTGSTALVIGGEDTGIRPLVLRHCDISCNIPQTASVSSLNASAAGAVAIYEAVRQRILTDS